MTITALPAAPSRASSPATFATQADALLGALPTFVTEANADIAAVNAAKVSADAALAAGLANAATNAATATTQAGIATTKAGIATTKAAEAAASAASIAGGPVASVNGRGGIVTGIAELSVPQSWSAKQMLGGSSASEAIAVTNIAELVRIVSAAPASLQTFYVASGSVQLYTSSALNNFTLNVAFSAGTALNTAMAIGDSITICLLVTQGGTAYFPTALQIDGVSVTAKWQGGSAPTNGTASSLESYTYTIVKTASATYTVIASDTMFK